MLDNPEAILIRHDNIRHFLDSFRIWLQKSFSNNKITMVDKKEVSKVEAAFFYQLSSFKSKRELNLKLDN